MLLVFENLNPHVYIYINNTQIIEPQAEDIKETENSLPFGGGNRYTIIKQTVTVRLMRNSYACEL